MRAWLKLEIDERFVFRRHEEQREREAAAEQRGEKPVGNALPPSREPAARVCVVDEREPDEEPQAPDRERASAGRVEKADRLENLARDREAARLHLVRFFIEDILRAEKDP